jgi:uncharacterized membrane protein YgdD (TMEM256/DUF423 family)
LDQIFGDNTRTKHIDTKIMANKFFLQAGAILGVIGVVLGAFGAHALKPTLEASGRMDTFETAVKYQFYHALALVLISILLQNASETAARWYNWAGYGMLVGVIVFSGALYTICFTGIKAFGAVAPIGGTLMIVGWALLFWGASKQ